MREIIEQINEFSIMNLIDPWWIDLFFDIPAILNFITIIMLIIVIVKLWKKQGKITDESARENILLGKKLYLIGSISVFLYAIFVIIWSIWQTYNDYIYYYISERSEIDYWSRYLPRQFEITTLIFYFISLLFQSILIFLSYLCYGKAWGKRSKRNITIMISFQAIYIIFSGLLALHLWDYSYLGSYQIFFPIVTISLFISLIIYNIQFKELKEKYDYEINSLYSIFLLPLLFIYELIMLILSEATEILNFSDRFFILSFYFGLALIQIIIYNELLLKGRKIKLDIIEVAEKKDEILNSTINESSIQDNLYQ